MDEIEERLRNHNNAFESLLGLIPSNLYYADPDAHLQWKRRKQTKEEKNNARKAKLDPETSIESALSKRKDILKTAAQNSELDSCNTDQQSDVQTLRRNKKDKSQSSGKNKQQKEKSDEKKPLDNLEKHAGKHQSESGDLDLSEQRDVTELLSENTEEQKASEEDISWKKKNTGRVDILELHEKVQRRIEELKAKRNAPGTLLSNNVVQTREAILENRRRKREERIEKRKKAKAEAKKIESNIEGTDQNLPPQHGESELESPRENQQTVNFGRIQLGDNEIYDPENKTKSTRKKRGPVDIKGALASLEAKQARIANYDEEKKHKIADSDAWHNSILRAEGEKIREDEKLLRKAVKRKDAQKRRSEQQWKEREDRIEQRKAFKQKKREENLARRRSEKKSGGKNNKPKSKAQKNPTKKKKRAGFEGSVRVKN